ncbi:MAG: hypothetical protein IKA09_04765 [Lachnospiraceae bacterium]|nr:hypothetical protein [Lachnospiraceae bacterium]
MITLYTAIGIYKLNTDGRPSIIAGNEEYALDTYELILWSTLAYRILSYDELKEMFHEQLYELHVTNERGFEHYLNRLLSRNLIASGSNYTGVDALYSLLGRLHVEILPNGLLNQVLTFTKLVLSHSVPLRTALAVFHKEETTLPEKWVLSMIRYQPLTTAELILCNEKGIEQLYNNDQLIDALYSDEHTDYESIVKDSCISTARNNILTAVANLYLKQRVNFYVA